MGKLSLGHVQHALEAFLGSDTNLYHTGRRPPLSFMDIKLDFKLELFEPKRTTDERMMSCENLSSEILLKFVNMLNCKKKKKKLNWGRGNIYRSWGPN